MVTEAAGDGRWGRLWRFGAVGASGSLVNLGALHLFAAVLGAPELAASAAAIELSVLWNFALNDVFTFRDRRSGPWPARLLRYHAVSAVGVAIQLGVFGAGLLVARHAAGDGLGLARYPVQAAGIALAFAWSFLGASRWAWRRPGAAVAPAAGTRRRLRPSLPAAIFWALIAVHVALLWSVRWFATQDGPLHVENVLALLHHPSSPLLQRYYLANWGAQPNWLTQLLLVPLLGLVSPPVAERLVLSGYTVLLPIAFRAVLPRGRRGWWASLLVFPFLHTFPFFMGFWNFLWGMSLSLLVVAWWQRVRGRLGPGRIAGMALLGACLYIAHAVAFGAACLALGVLWATRAGSAWVRSRGAPARRRLVARGYGAQALGLGLALAPGAALLGTWMFAHRDHVVARIPFLELLAKLGAGYAMVSIDRRELFVAPVVSAILGLALAAAALRRLSRRGGERRLVPRDGWLGVALVFATLYFAVPDVADAGAHISDRFAVLAFLSAAAWLAGRSTPLPWIRGAGLALAALALVALGVRWDKERVLSSYVDEYVSAAHAVGEDPVVLPLALAPGGPKDAKGRKLGYRVKPFLHATGWIVAAQGGVDLKNSQATTDQCPVRFVPGRNPFQTIAASLGRMEGVPPCVDLRLSPRVGPIDYVLVWGATRENLDTPCGAALADELTRRYEPVFLSEPRGLLEVWRPRTLIGRRRAPPADGTRAKPEQFSMRRAPPADGARAKPEQFSSR